MIMKSEIILIFLLILTTFVVNTKAQRNLYTQYEWKYLDFQFPSAAVRDSAIKNRLYIKGNSFPLDIDVYNGASRTLQFVTIPRFFDGTPITLGTISGVSGDGGPIIAPFPDYGWHQTGNCNGFTNVLRVAVDECQRSLPFLNNEESILMLQMTKNLFRLWVLDSGVINDIQVCPAKLVIFNLGSPTVAPFTHIFPSTLYRYMSLFITPIVDARNCYDSMVYVADVTGFGIIVYDYKNNRSWRTESQSDHLRPIAQYSSFFIAGERFNLTDGVFGMAVSPKTYTNRQLFFHALASAAESRIPLSVLDNPANWPVQNPIMNPNQFVQMGLRQTTQTTVQAFDYNGNLFFGTVIPPGIGCWDSTKPYINDNLKLVARNDVTLQFISGLKIIPKNGVPELWVLSCRFQKIMAGTRNINEVNYRVLKISINELLGGNSKCNGPLLPFN